MKAGVEEVGEPPKDDALKTAVNRVISVLDFIMVYENSCCYWYLGKCNCHGNNKWITSPFHAVHSFQGSIQWSSHIHVSVFFSTRRVYHQFIVLTYNVNVNRFFVVANSIVTAYLILSLALSIFYIAKSSGRVTRTVLIIFDTVMFSENTRLKEYKETSKKF